MTKEKNTKEEITRQELETLLWNAADSSRSHIDGNLYKDYALAMLFYKYLSDKTQKIITKLKKRYYDDEKAIQERLALERFNIPEQYLFNKVFTQKEKDNIGSIINKALAKIVELNHEKLDGIFNNVDFNSESLGNVEQRTTMIRNLLSDFAKIDLTDISEDVLGEGYMYMIERFGADAGKKAGEFFTPHQVAQLVAQLADPEEGHRIYDPACGSAGMLLLTGAEVEKKGSNNYALYGQESNGATYNLARMNAFLHGKDSAHFAWGDTLGDPRFIEGKELMKFDTIVANPPYSLKKWGADKAEKDPFNRFWRGIPPKDKGDYAFILHMIESAKKRTGRVVTLVPHGVLFRGGAEGKIRKQLIEENLIDAVIGLPAGLFSTTGIPVAILILDRSREQGGANEKKKDILFIEASKEFTKGKAQNTLEDKHIDKIYKAYKKRKDVEKFAHVASIEEIKENDYNLNITRYVDTFEEEEPVDIEANIKELAKLEPELKKLEQKMQGYLKDLGIIK